MTYYSQGGEDRFLLDNQLLPPRGIFVDVGAGDPVLLNNTYALEKLGWDGLSIEPHPAWTSRWQRCRGSRYESCAVKSYDGTVVLYQPSDLLLCSTLPQPGEVSRRTVPCYQLERLLQKHEIGKIDLLSIDVEGTELEVCDSMNWQAHQPTIVIIEYNTFGRPSNDQVILDYFQCIPYTHIHTSTFNLIFQLTADLARSQTD